MGVCVIVVANRLKNCTADLRGRERLGGSPPWYTLINAVIMNEREMPIYILNSILICFHNDTYEWFSFHSKKFFHKTFHLVNT